jgi:hypothetical protein
MASTIWTPADEPDALDFWIDPSDLSTVVAPGGVGAPIVSVECKVTGILGSSFHNDGTGIQIPTLTLDSETNRHMIEMQGQPLRWLNVNAPGQVVFIVGRNNPTNTENLQTWISSGNDRKNIRINTTPNPDEFNTVGGNFGDHHHPEDLFYQNGTLNNAANNGTIRVITSIEGSLSVPDDYINITLGFAAAGVPRLFEGQMGEVIIANDTSQDYIDKVTSYLCWKWGLRWELDASNPYKDAPLLADTTTTIKTLADHALPGDIFTAFYDDATVNSYTFNGAGLVNGFTDQVSGVVFAQGAANSLLDDVVDPDTGLRALATNGNGFAQIAVYDSTTNPFTFSSFRTGISVGRVDSDVANDDNIGVSSPTTSEHLAIRDRAAADAAIRYVTPGGAGSGYGIVQVVDSGVNTLTIQSLGTTLTDVTVRSQFDTTMANLGPATSLSIDDARAFVGLRDTTVSGDRAFAFARLWSSRVFTSEMVDETEGSVHWDIGQPSELRWDHPYKDCPPLLVITDSGFPLIDPIMCPLVDPISDPICPTEPLIVTAGRKA